MTNIKKEMQRRERKKQAIRDAIFKTAQNLFITKGFENTSVEDITEKIDIAQSTFFNYFPRKEDLLAEIFKRKLPYLKKKCQEIQELDAPIKTKINKIFSTTARIAAKQENITRAMLIRNFTTLNKQQYDGVFFEWTSLFISNRVFFFNFNSIGKGYFCVSFNFSKSISSISLFFSPTKGIPNCMMNIA